MEGKPLTGIRKRQQIEQTSKQMLLWVTGASAIITICATLALNFVGQIQYQAKVISKKTETNKTLESNLGSISKLMTNVNSLQANKNLLSLRADSEDTAFNVIIDALPTENDSTALASSIQSKVLAGTNVTLDNFDPGYNSQSTTNASSSKTSNKISNKSLRPEPQALSFSFQISGDYNSVKSALVNIEKTTRPIIIDSISMQGTSDNLSANISATTYYMPKVHYDIGSEIIQPDGASNNGGSKK